jgi:guanylate kinase
VHYYFIGSEEFERMARAGEFLEHAVVFGNRYGTARAVIERLLAEGRDILLDIDWQGARAVKAKMPEAVSVFILPPSRQALEERLRNRGQDTPEVIARRLAQAVEDMRRYKEFDHVVVNDDFQAALADLRAIIRGQARPRPLAIDLEALLRG